MVAETERPSFSSEPVFLLTDPSILTMTLLFCDIRQGQIAVSMMQNQFSVSFTIPVNTFVRTFTIYCLDLRFAEGLSLHFYYSLYIMLSN
jgi:hypothetical protein